MFARCDTDGSGRLSLSEFRAALGRAAAPKGRHEIDRGAPGQVSEEEAARLMSCFDLDNDGRIGYSEFMHMLQGLSERDAAAVWDSGVVSTAMLGELEPPVPAA